jgi:hypothetical protein
MSLIRDGPLSSLKEADLPGFPALALVFTAALALAGVFALAGAFTRGFVAAAGFFAFFVFFTFVPSS